MPVTTVMVSEAPNVAQPEDSHYTTVPVLLIRSGIRVVVKITSTVPGSILSIPNMPEPAPAGPVTGRWRAASAVVTENPQNHHQQASTQVYHILYSTLPLSDWQKLCPLGIRP